MKPSSYSWRHDTSVAMGKSGNKDFICISESSVGSRGFLLHQNPMHYSTPILLLQLFISSITTMVFDSFLRPLGQTTIVSQFLGGLLFGPSLLGHNNVLGSSLFPPRGSLIFETSAMFGLLFFFFIIAVKSDAAMMIKPTRVAVIMGIGIFVTSLGFAIPMAIMLQMYVPMPPSLSNALPLIALSQCLTPFPNISCVLTELKILNTDLGKLAMSAAMFCDMLGMFVIAVGFAVTSSKSSTDAVLGVGSVFALVFGCVYILRPVMTGHILRQAQKGNLREVHIVIIFIFVMVSGLTSEVIGQHIVLGPLVLGLAMPEGPPLGSVIVDKLYYPIVKILYPTYLTASGLKTNIFTIHGQALWVISSIFLFSALIKVGTVVLISCFVNLTVRDAVVVGLMLNARGICELVLYNLWMDTQLLTQEGFSVSVLMVILITGSITPLIKYMYNPTKKMHPMKRRTIQHAKRDEELRILVCIHNQDNVPSLINLLEASNATEESPIAVIGVILIELVGRTAPMLIAHHQSSRAPESTSTKSDSIVNALRGFESYNHGRVSVQSYTSVSHFETMDEDVCRLALDQNTNIVIMPFHKTWAIDGNVGHVDRNIRGFNLKVMEKVPCTVGVLIDRGNINGSYTIINTNSIYHVAVIYIGGLDDIESVCYGARMVAHENVTVTVFRFLVFGCDTARERKFDNNLIDEIRQTNAGNERFIYQEEVVRDGVGLASSLRRIEHGYNLIIVGKHHPDSPLMAGLDAWSECPELGIVGDLLASPDLQTTSSLLVLQQQRVKGKLASRSMKPLVIDTQLHGVPRIATTTSTGSGSNRSTKSFSVHNNSNNSWSIPMSNSHTYN